MKYTRPVCDRQLPPKTPQTTEAPNLTQEPLCPFCGVGPLPFTMRASAKLDWILAIEDALAQAEAGEEEVVIVVKTKQGVVV
jgi:hypothetical protein